MMFENRTVTFDFHAMKTFPEKELERVLREFYNRKVGSPLRRKRVKPVGNVFDLQPEVSSQETTRIVALIEPLMGFRVKTGEIIKKGGYKSLEEFVMYTIPRLRQAFYKKYAPPARARAHSVGGMISVR